MTLATSVVQTIPLRPDKEWVMPSLAESARVFG